MEYKLEEGYYNMNNLQYALNYLTKSFTTLELYQK